MKNGSEVQAFEAEFAAYVGAKYAIALCNGTATLHTALVALGVKPGDRVAVPPLTMSATTIAVLQAGGVPKFWDVDEKMWLASQFPIAMEADFYMPVSLYGLHSPMGGKNLVDDAAQTLRPFERHYKTWPPSFVSYSFQASKILSLGEGGMLVTNDEELAVKAREFSSLGYRMLADQPRIDPQVLKSPTFERHHTYPSFNYRMNDLTALEGSWWLEHNAPSKVERAKTIRREAARLYRLAHQGCDWLTPQFVPEGWMHDYWTYALLCDSAERALALAKEIMANGGERPYFAWRLTFDEPAFRHLDPGPQACPVARSLQPRLLHFQTNHLQSAEQNAHALTLAIRDLS